MNARIAELNADTRLFDVTQGCSYTQLGRSTFVKWCESIGAVRRFGSLVRYDKKVIDAALDSAEFHPTVQ